MRAREDDKSIEESARQVKEERDRRVRDATIDSLSGLAVTQFLEVLEQEQVRVLVLVSEFVLVLMKLCVYAALYVLPSCGTCSCQYFHAHTLSALVCVCVCVCVLREGGK